VGDECLDNCGRTFLCLWERKARGVSETDTLARQVSHDIPLPLGEESPRRIGSRYVGEAGVPRHSSPFALGEDSRASARQVRGSSIQTLNS